MDNLELKENKELLEILEKILRKGKFDIPSHRLGSPKWLFKNLEVRNNNNPLFKEAMEVINILYSRGV